MTDADAAVRASSARHSADRQLRAIPKGQTRRLGRRLTASPAQQPRTTGPEQAVGIFLTRGYRISLLLSHSSTATLSVPRIGSQDAPRSTATAAVTRDARRST